MAIARTKNVGISDYKLRLVIDQIRGKMVTDAVPVLRYLTSPADAEILKILNAATANAEHNDGADIDELKVKTIYVEQGTTLKRFTARAKGRGNRISKPTCHVYVTVGN